MTIQEGELLWTPREAFAKSSQLASFMDWLRVHRQLDFTDYAALWQWSVDCLEDFWAAVWEYFEIESSTPYEYVLKERTMPGAARSTCCARASMGGRPSIIAARSGHRPR